MARSKRVRCAVKPLDLERDRDLRPELQGLVEGAAGERLSRDARRKPQVILDPGGGSGLAAHRAPVEHDDRQPFGGGIDGGGQPRRPCAHDRHVIDRVRVELGRDAQTSGKLALRRVPQQGATGADDERQLIGMHAEALHHRLPAGIGRGIEHEVGVTAAGQKPLEPHDIGTVRRTDQDGSRATRLDETDAAQDQGAHHDFTDLGRSDHQGAQMGCVERKQAASFGAGATRRE